jgi:hypothetical protein
VRHLDREVDGATGVVDTRHGEAAIRKITLARRANPSDALLFRGVVKGPEDFVEQIERPLR